MIFRFTHTSKWTGCFPASRRPASGWNVRWWSSSLRDGKLSNEHIYWDQASVLGAARASGSANLPVAGLRREKLADASLPPTI